MKIFITCFFVALSFLFPQNTKAQTVIKIPEIDIIGYYNSGDYHLYHKVADNKYYSIDLDFDSIFYRDKDSMSSTFSIKIWDDDTYTFDEVKKDNDVIFKKDELKKQSLSEIQSYLMQNSWRIWEEGDDDETFVLKAINSAIISLSELHFDIARAGGPGIYEKIAENEVNKWRPYDVEFVNTIYIETDPDRYFIIFNDNYEDKGLFIPLEKEDIILNDIFDSNKSEKLKSTDSLSQIDTKEIFNFLDPEDFYQQKFTYF